MDAPPSSSHCPVTGISIPECCCRQCVQRQLQAHAPWLLEPAPSNVATPDFSAEDTSESKAA